MTSYTRARSCATRSGRRTCPSYTRSAAPSRTSSVARREGDISVKSRRRRATASSRTSAGAMRMASSSWAASRRLVSARRLLGPTPRVDARRGRPGRVGPHGYALEATLDRSGDPRTLAERTARAAALCGRPDPRPRLRCLRRDLEEARTLLCYAADATAARTWVADGATSQGTRPPCSRTAFTVAGASRRRASTPGSRSTASGSSAATRTHQRARARRRHARYDRQQAAYTLAGMAPRQPSRRAPRNPELLTLA